jgi:integral membrane protein (TIGR00529 family)
MVALVKIAVVIFVLLFLVRRKWDLGLILVLDAALVAVLFRMPARDLLAQAGGALIAWETVSLLLIIFLVLYLGHFLQAGGHFRMMVDALKKLVRDPRLILALPSAFIGLLPMMAGAMMGAPIVEEAARRWDLSPAWKTFYNYWFRHIWEYSWPLYLNLILAAAIVKVPIGRICLVQAPFTALAAGTGLVILFKRVPRLPSERERPGNGKDLARVFLSIWPIVLTIVLIFVFRLDMLVALAVSGLLTLVLTRVPVRDRLGLILKSASPRIVALIAALMVFKRVLEASGALDAVMRAFPPRGPAAIALLFAAPFFIGLLTGVNQAFVAIAFPLLVPIIGEGKPDMVLLVFAYVSGFVGILLSPAHLCLVLTAEYFKAPLKDVYRILAGPVAVVFGAALLALIVLRVL